MGLFVNSSAGNQWAWVDPHVPGPEGYYAKWGTTTDGQQRPLSPPGPCAGGNWSGAAPARHAFLPAVSCDWPPPVRHLTGVPACRRRSEMIGEAATGVWGWADADCSIAYPFMCRKPGGRPEQRAGSAGAAGGCRVAESFASSRRRG